jgi:adenine-specific DNA-methyltransferase
MDYRANLRFPITLPDGRQVWPEKQWQWSKERVEHAQENDEVVFSEGAGKISVSYKQYLRDIEGEERRRKLASIITGYYTQQGTAESVNLFGQEHKFSFPKPEGLILHILECCTSPGDVVLDSFAGSGTTGAVAHKMARRWIMVELGEHCHTHIIPRMKKVIDGDDHGGITETVGWKGGGGFRYYRLAPSLLEKDRWGNWVISRLYNPAMLAEAVCKLMGFTYAPSEEYYWMHGFSSERDFIYVTTQSLTGAQLRAISEDVGEHRSLLICCKAFRADVGAFPNLSVKKIPQAVLRKCEWGKDDYSLSVASLSTAKLDEEPFTSTLQAADLKIGQPPPHQPDLFNEAASK